MKVGSSAASAQSSHAEALNASEAAMKSMEKEHASAMAELAAEQKASQEALEETGTVYLTAEQSTKMQSQ